MTPTHNDPTISLIAAEYARASTPWYIGYSGGKDSSAVLTLLFLALADAPTKSTPITILYVDTGVEIPPVRDLALSFLNAYQTECTSRGIPLAIAVVSPPLADRYLVKVIGRGYPPPTNKFRWCTRRLRTNPVNRFFRDSGAERGILLLGVRRGESASRDRTIARYSSSNHAYLRQDREKGLLVFAPIIDYSTEEVWATLLENPVPSSIDADALFALYEDASGEVPIIHGPSFPPYGRGRLGCWTCTVVRKDRALASLVSNGYPALQPLLQFRNWLATMRDDPQYRCDTRRNGAPGPGPLTLRARRVAFQRLMAAQEEAGLQLLSPGESTLIQRLWEEDINSPAYRER